MLSTDDRRRIRFWRPDSPSVTGMLRVECEDRIRTTYSEHFLVVVVYQGAFDGWYRGAVRTHVAGAIKLKEPGEIHRDLRVHAPFTIQGAMFSHETVAAAAAMLGLRGPVHFKSSGFGPEERATRLAFAMHAALVCPDVPEIERATLVAETLGEILGEGSRSGTARGGERAARAVRLARAVLHDSLADKITLGDLATHAGMDKYHLVRAFRAQVGLPPYEYLTHARVSKARELLQRGALVADAAQAVGFCDESQLHRHFRRIIGITPGRFSKSFAGSARRSQHRPIRARETGTDSPYEEPPRSDGCAHAPAILRLGDLEVQRLGYGAIRLPGKDAWGEPDDPDRAREVLRRAVDLGINFIDTAWFYGPSVANRLIFEALHPYPRDLVIATKLGSKRLPDKRWAPAARPEELRRGAEDDLRTLHMERLDLVHLRFMPNSGVPLMESLDALVAMQAEGKIRHLALSSVDVQQVEAVLARTPIIAVQNMFSAAGAGGMLAKFSNAEVEAPEAVLDLCSARGIAYLPFFPLAAGNVGKHKPALTAIAARHGASPSQIALAWLLARSPVILPIPGTSSLAHLEENWEARRIALSPQEMEAISK